jgi:bacterioferritin-associated ferredoxin
MIVCLCGAVSDSTIREAIHGGASTVEGVGDACMAGTECGKCRTTIELMLLTESARMVGPGRRGNEEAGR